MKLRIMASRHSAFYSPLLATLGRGFDATYSVLPAGQRSQDLIREGVVDIMQSAVSSNWQPMERGEGPLPVHFALINRRDGFFIAAPEGADEAFEWKKLQGRTLLADRGGQPLAMLKYAVAFNGVDWNKIYIVDQGDADYIHRQAPGPWRPVASVGASVPEVAFSTLCCAREFIGTPAYEDFVAAYNASRDWVRTTAPEDVAVVESSFFPAVSVNDLADAIEAYQKLGTWSGSTEITEALYDQSLNVFEHSGGITSRHPRSAVCL
jgi:NitT/TauT family transport system substrate-binding protein